MTKLIIENRIKNCKVSPLSSMKIIDSLEKKVTRNMLPLRIVKVIKNLSEQGYTMEKEYIGMLLKSRGKEELHRIIELDM